MCNGTYCDLFSRNEVVVILTACVLSSYQKLSLSSYQVAKQLRADSWGLVFGINMFMSLFIQSVLTLVVVQILEIDPQIQVEFLKMEN